MRKLIIATVLLVMFIHPVWAFKAVLTGDSRDDTNGILPAIVRDASKTPGLAAVVHTGDVTSVSRPHEYQIFKKVMSPVKVPILVVPGNHDKKNAENYRKYIGSFYSSRKIGAWRFIMLDNANGKLGTGQLGWLKRELTEARSNKEYTVLVTHVPLYFTGQDRVMSGTDRRSLLKLIKDYKVKLVVSGHIHGYANEKRDGVTYLTTGGAGAPLRNEHEFYHYVLADFRDNGTFSLQLKKINRSR